MINQTDFGQGIHKIPTFNAVVDPELTKATITDPEYWVNVGNKIPVNSEIRCVARDHTFVAYLFVSHVEDRRIKAHVLDWHVLGKAEKINEYKECIIRKDERGWYAVDQDANEMFDSLRTSSQKKIKDAIDEHKQALAA
jgi:hypothetical protein